MVEQVEVVEMVETIYAQKTFIDQTNYELTVGRGSLDLCPPDYADATGSVGVPPAAYAQPPPQ